MKHRNVLAAALVVVAVVPATARAASPGRNGEIAFVRGNVHPYDDGGDLYRIKPGAGRERLLLADGYGISRPRYSPDGKKIAFLVSAYPSSVVVANADGTGRRT